MGTSTVSSKKNKAAKSALAVALALMLALGGTLAWTSFSQVARNEFKASANPGGRLHDDFIWTDGVKNKDVYVENFTDAATGQNIYARVQLREYLEIGTGAGEYRDPATTTGLTPYPTGASATDKSKWQVHAYDKNATAPSHEASTDDFHKYFEFAYGGATKYMPTFNKNKDSLEADVNGSLRDEATGQELNYSNYRDWSLPANASVADIAYYDNDENTTDEAEASPGAAPGAGGTYPENYIYQNETHNVQTSLGASVITMTQWEADGSKPGAFWVYDDKANNGWFYWAQAIEPSTATGKLLDNVVLKGAIGDDWYYAIDAIGEFVTSEEIRTDGTGAAYYFGGEDSEGKAMSQNAYDLLTAAAAAAGESTTTGAPIKDYKVAVARPAASVSQGATVAPFTASVTESGNAVTPTSVTWSVSGGTGATAIAPSAMDQLTGILTIDANQAVGSTLTITATAAIGSQTATGVNTVKVVARPPLSAALQAVKNAPVANNDPTGSIVTINNDDGAPVQYVKLAEDGDNALLIKKDFVGWPQYGADGADTFGNTNIWRDSYARKWSNSTYLVSLPKEIKDRLVEKDINTKTAYNDDTIITTKDKVFFLTEADVFGQNEGAATSDAKYYTYGNSSLLPPSLHVAGFEGRPSNWWLRSPRGGVDQVAYISPAGGSYNTSYSSLCFVCPAFWINLAS